MRRGDYNAGSHINVLLRLRCKTSASLGASHELKIALMDKRQCLLFGGWSLCEAQVLIIVVGTLDGGLGYLLPVPEKVYRRLNMLQLKMNQGLRHGAGLNPKGFRYISYISVVTPHHYTMLSLSL